MNGGGQSGGGQSGIRRQQTTRREGNGPSNANQLEEDEGGHRVGWRTVERERDQQEEEYTAFHQQPQRPESRASDSASIHFLVSKSGNGIGWAILEIALIRFMGINWPKFL